MVNCLEQSSCIRHTTNLLLDYFQMYKDNIYLTQSHCRSMVKKTVLGLDHILVPNIHKHYHCHLLPVKNKFM